MIRDSPHEAANYGYFVGNLALTAESRICALSQTLWQEKAKW